MGFSEESTQKKQQLKKNYFDNKIVNEKLYKFIGFNNDEPTNRLKIEALKDEKLWFGAYYTFEDDTELKININPQKVARLTGTQIEYSKFLVETLREMNDICCLTTGIRDEMWREYANNGNGVCLVFDIISYEYIMPVIYAKKEDVDYTSVLVGAINCKNKIKHDGSVDLNISRLTFEPNVLKDKEKYQFEDEVRLLCGDAYDESSGNLGGRVIEGKKKSIGYLGTYYPYNYVGLRLNDIIFGSRLVQSIEKEIKAYMNR